MIQIYGSSRSSAGRCYLVLEEIGLPYKQIPLNMAEREHKSAAYLRLNPNGKVPCLIDDGFVIWESLAINHYLAEKYKPELLGSDAKSRGLVVQWSTWGVNELQAPLIEMVVQLMFTPEDKRDFSIVNKAREKVGPALKILDQGLEGKTYLVGEQLTLADLNLAPIVNLAVGFDLPIASYPSVKSWFDHLIQRASVKKLFANHG